MKERIRIRGSVWERLGPLDDLNPWLAEKIRSGKARTGALFLPDGREFAFYQPTVGAVFLVDDDLFLYGRVTGGS